MLILNARRFFHSLCCLTFTNKEELSVFFNTMFKSIRGLYPANAVCFQWCLKELRTSQAHCYSQFPLCSPEYSGCLLVAPNPCRLLLTFMEILYSTAL